MNKRLFAQVCVNKRLFAQVCAWARDRIYCIYAYIQLVYNLYKRVYNLFTLYMYACIQLSAFHRLVWRICLDAYVRILCEGTGHICLEICPRGFVNVFQCE
jgi:hypothetical protein